MEFFDATASNLGRTQARLCRFCSLQDGCFFDLRRRTGEDSGILRGRLRYRSQLPLGYCGVFCWPAVHHSFWQIAEEPLLDYLHVAAYCNDLPAADSRHVKLDDKSAKARFPVLFRFDRFPFGLERSSDASSLLARMGSFAARHEFRAARFAELKKQDEDDYLNQSEHPEKFS